ncbi:Tex family protein [Methanorbis furvi]|uniref:Protein YhgF n=1 Tax=Methanorbis furvi TaxID=3028299 RepID=A0AAE4MBA7_9EURY|nr:Protein YhgF [Methanocorpusculaceae archaeon Ag1]
MILSSGPGSTRLCRKVADALSLSEESVTAVASLFGGGATVPFIARYRKEATGSLDEVAIASVRDALIRIKQVDDRRGTILTSLRERKILTADLQNKLLSADTVAEIEDIYLPYRPKRQTRASVARDRGLEPLAAVLRMQDPRLSPSIAAATFLSDAVPTAADALAGARDILAEEISENADVRGKIRGIFAGSAHLSSDVIKGKAEDASVYAGYFAWDELITRAASHRILAVMRGEREGVLRLHLAPPEDVVLKSLHTQVVTGRGEASAEVAAAATDAYRRLILPSLEREFFNTVKERADTEAIAVFADNLRHLLLAAPAGEKRVLAIDPGYRTGCKLVCLDATGNVVETGVIYPQTNPSAARAALIQLCKTHAIDIIAVGNGTAGRETEKFVRGITFGRPLPVLLTSECGASVYSASAEARREFPDLDITLRGAVSIGRRVQDPLAELVKIDPKSLGVGQYQHDVDQNRLAAKLADIVEQIVNSVGVNLNTASASLLSYVSGIGPSLAEKIVVYRTTNGPFKNRGELLNVPGVGPKTFEQAAGFLRIIGGDNPLDMTGIHPERYSLVERMAKDLGVSAGRLAGASELLKRIEPEKYVSEDCGLVTIEDIIDELGNPGRDIRITGEEKFSFDQSIHELSDLAEGMVLPGVVTNVTAFGAFVDVGVHQDGLVHVSELADRFVAHPSEIVSVGKQVRVMILSVDAARSRISMSIKRVM